MNWIVMAIISTAIVFLVALSLWCAKKEDEQQKNILRRLEELEKKDNTSYDLNTKEGTEK